MSTAIRRTLEIAQQARQLRIDRRDNVLVDRLAEAMQLAPGTDSPTLEEQMHDGPVPVRHVPDDDAQGDLLEQRERPMRFDQW